MAAEPFDLASVAVTRNARVIFNDCRLLTEKTIEERALADVGSTNDDDALAGVSHIHLPQANDGRTVPLF